MLKIFNNFSKLTENNFSPVRCYAKKILSAEPSLFEDLPVYEYPMKSSRETSVYGWGFGQHGALGHYIQKKKKMKGRKDNRFKNFKIPFRLLFGEQHKVIDIAAGYGFSALLVKSNDQNKVFGTGLNTDSQLGYQAAKANSPLELILAPVPINLGLKNPTKTKVISLSAGRAHLAVATDLEGVFMLGNNSYGQCGRTIIKNEKYFGSRVVHNIPNFDNDKVKSVECGQDHTLFLTESGKVYSCGWGADGQTGLGQYSNQFLPKRVLGDIKNENIVKLSSKCDCVLAINDKGDVFGWGNSEYSQLFSKLESFQQINSPIFLKKCQGFGKIVDVAAAGSFCMMLNDAGEVFSWGYGILGRGPNVCQSWQPQMIPPILFGRNEFRPDSQVKSIYCGLNYSAAITNFGDIYSWGKNKQYCLGLLDVKDQYFPLKVYIGATAKKLSLGVDHTLALCHPFGN